MSKKYVIKDSQKRFNGKIVICFDPETKDTKWEYYSNAKPTYCNTCKENVELELQELQELNNLAGFDLEWEVVEITKDNLIASNIVSSDNFSIKYKNVQKGKITAYRKMVRETYKKYKSMVKEQVA